MKVVPGRPSLSFPSSYPQMAFGRSWPFPLSAALCVTTPQRYMVVRKRRPPSVYSIKLPVTHAREEKKARNKAETCPP